MILTDYMIVKSNKLIESKSNFSAMENRIIVFALAQIRPHDQRLRMYRIPILSVLGGKKNRSNYNHVRESARKLIGTSIHIEEEDGWKSYAFITKAQGKYRDNFIEIEFHRDIQKFLIGLREKYTAYTLNNVINFKHNYSLRIYELCKQYATCVKNYYGSQDFDDHNRKMCGQENGYFFRVINLDYLRTFLALEKKYPRFNNFRMTVLCPSIEEINLYSDLFVEFEEIKAGSRVEAIKFIIRQNKNAQDEHQIKDFLNLDSIEDWDENLLGLRSDMHFIDDDKHNKNRKVQKINDSDSSEGWRNIHENQPNFSDSEPNFHQKRAQMEMGIRLIRCGFGKEEVRKIQQKYAYNFLQLTLDLCENNKDSITHLPSWISVALRENYVGYYSSPKNLNKNCIQNNVNVIPHDLENFDESFLEKNPPHNVANKGKKSFFSYAGTGNLCLEDLEKLVIKSPQNIAKKARKNLSDREKSDDNSEF